jgi:hypothetical protein
MSSAAANSQVMDEAVLATQVASGCACAQEKINKPTDKVSVTRDSRDMNDKRPTALCAAQSASHRIIQDALGSPGCTRAVMTATVLESMGLESAAV